jgi:stress-induced morphogen
MLIERLQEVKELLEARETMRSERQVIQALEARLKAISVLDEKLEGLTVIASDFAPDPEQLRRLRTQVEELRKRFTEPTIPGEKVTSPIKATLDEIETQMNNRWQKHTQSVRQSKQMHKARIVSQIANSQQRIRLAQHSQAVNSKLVQPKPTREVVEGLQQALQALDQQVQEAFPDVPLEVQSFLERLVSQQASLLDATPSVIAWCAKHQLLQRITLKLSESI